MDEDLIAEIHRMMMVAARKEREIADLFDDIAQLGAPPNLYDPEWWAMTYRTRADVTERMANWWLDKMLAK